MARMWSAGSAAGFAARSRVTPVPMASTNSAIDCGGTAGDVPARSWSPATSAARCATVRPCASAYRRLRTGSRAACTRNSTSSCAHPCSLTTSRFAASSSSRAASDGDFPAAARSFSAAAASARSLIYPGAGRCTSVALITFPPWPPEASMDNQVKYVLQESQLPRQWYNVVPDLPSPPPPPLHPGTREPVGPDALAPLFPMAPIQQEVSPERYIAIPEEVLDVYRLWRPTPLFRARRLEKELGTPARIYYKYEGVSPAGSHKPNTAVPQAYYNAAEGVTKLTTETGAGQWGSALAFASAVYGLACEVWMVRASYDQKPYRRLLMEAYGAKVHPSPSELTSAGRAVLADHPDSTGSLGIAISEAVEVAAPDPATRYALGSVLNHVLMHQTVIGEEAIKQLAMAGDTPDLIVGCTGGGSNFSGLVFPFLREKLAGRINPVLRAVEPAACPSFTRGVYAYDFGDTAGTTPLFK